MQLFKTVAALLSLGLSSSAAPTPSGSHVLHEKHDTSRSSTWPKTSEVEQLFASEYYFFEHKDLGSISIAWDEQVVESHASQR